jgi:hypothetical protein
MARGRSRSLAQNDRPAITEVAKVRPKYTEPQKQLVKAQSCASPLSRTMAMSQRAVAAKQMELAQAKGELVDFRPCMSLMY